ncbi:MAG: NADH:ubiquinone reductase (Na(+)-transporting) subunit C [Flavobacteriales bacterium]|nr:NADH:ubiquinone reductase (Na(+)-transporting) subunit C [Bacteroidota bacterium]MCB9239941.1 NADH:ubiquinone reductase (Na(+)-transporting) subunit C [Flavobacteriales bacterium]
MSLNKNTNGYIFGFALLVILVCGVLLAAVSGALSEKQQMERELERKKFILQSSLGDEISGMTKQDIAALYEKRVEEMVLDSNGKAIDGVSVNQVVLGKEYKKLEKNGTIKKGENIQLPIYLVKAENSEDVQYYVMPMFGFGLWDNIWGYAALKSDLNTLQGVVLDHKGETPGLGARITEQKVQSRYQGKTVADESGAIVSVKMEKGEGNDYSNKPHSVDGMSGATLTAVGVNNMMENYLRLYGPYIESAKQNK